MPNKIKPPDYPSHFEVRRVSNAGCFKLHSRQVFLSQALNGEHIGLEEVDDGVWNIIYYETLLGRTSQETSEITGPRASDSVDHVLEQSVSYVPGGSLRHTYICVDYHTWRRTWRLTMGSLKKRVVWAA
jgi:hypothetical protein